MINLSQKLRPITTVNRELNKRPDLKNLIESSSKVNNIFDLPNVLSNDRIELYKKSYFGVGNTETYKINLPNENRLHLKMEYSNAMGNNHYSRYWLAHLFICEILGVIFPEETQIIEVTSGSSGIALSKACEVLGYDVTILVPKLLPEARIAPMRNSTTTIIQVEGYINHCIDRLRGMIKTGNYYATNHSEEKADIITYVFSRIGKELISDVNGSIDYGCLAMGNGTSTYAIANEIKKEHPNSKIIAYRPHYEENPEDIIFGLIAANIECRHISDAKEVIDKIRYTTGIDLSFVRELYKYDSEISNLGQSSLYGVYFALKLAGKVKNKNIITIGYDKSDRY